MAVGIPLTRFVISRQFRVYAEDRSLKAVALISEGPISHCYCSGGLDAARVRRSSYLRGRVVKLLHRGSSPGYQSLAKKTAIVL